MTKHIAQVTDEHPLVRERDRLQLLLEVNNMLVSNLDLRELLSAISACLKRMLPHDVAALVLYDSSINALRAKAMDFPEHEDLCTEEEILPLDNGNPAGLAFTTRRPAFADSRTAQSVGGQRFAAAGATFTCLVPLVSRDRALGAMGVASVSEHAFTEEDAALLEQIAKQVAIAVENALAYQEIETLKNKLEEESSTSKKKSAPNITSRRSSVRARLSSTLYRTWGRWRQQTRMF